MLPITVQFMVAMLACAMNERMARKAEYLRKENRVLKEALLAAMGKSRIPLTHEQRRRLTTEGKALTPAERKECCQMVRPSTILAWFRQLVSHKYDLTGRFHQIGSRAFGWLSPPRLYLGSSGWGRGREPTRTSVWDAAFSESR